MDEHKKYSDDLFREAGENYPLKTDNENWESVLNRIKAPVTTTPFLAKPNQTYKWRYAWLLLLLLIPAGIMFTDYFHSTGSGNLKEDKPVVQSPKQGQANPGYPIIPHTENKQAETAGNVMNNIGQENSNIVRQQNEVFSQQLLSSNENATKPDLQPNTYLPIVAGKTVQLNNSDALALNPADKKIIEAASLLPLPLNSILGKKEIIAGNIVENNNSKRSVIQLKPKDRFYLAISAGPSFSSVKTQPIDKTGYSLGMLLGYNVNKNIDIETGVLFVKKYFNARGKEFNQDIIKTPEGTRLVSLNGEASITQIPLNVIYNFSSKTTSHFFVTANLVTNVIHSESYNYMLKENETFNELSRSYKKGSDNLFSNLSVGVGYTQNLGSEWKLSAEPYYQYPLSGIGLGKLFIQTYGINIKISKAIKKN